MRVGYARVSTADQDLQLQRDALAAAGADLVYEDTASGASRKRPELAAALQRVSAGDTLIVWKLDRLGRSMKHLVDVITDLDDRGVMFVSLTEGFDTRTNVGRMLFHVVGALAEFERDLIQERTRAGLDAARRRGRKGGRPRALTRAQEDEVRRMVLEEGRSRTEVARLFEVHRSTVSRLTRP